MSADNYYVIFREGDTYYPVMGFASDDEDGLGLNLEDRHRASGGFEDPYKAFEWAEAQNPEYGVSFADAARPSEFSKGDRCTCSQHMGMRDPEPGCPIDHDQDEQNRERAIGYDRAIRDVFLSFGLAATIENGETVFSLPANPYRYQEGNTKVLRSAAKREREIRREAWDEGWNSGYDFHDLRDIPGCESLGDNPYVEGGGL